MKTLFCATLVGILFTFSAGATTLLRMTEDELIDQAAIIVAGRCGDLESRWLGGTLFTLASITVDETLKGGKASEVTVAIPGGVDLDRPVPVSVVFPGAPVVAPGQEVVLFLEPFAALEDGYSVVGFSQGKLEIIAPPGGEKLARWSGGAATSTLGELRELVRSVLDASTAK